MKTRIAAVVTALVLSAAPISSAMASNDGHRHAPLTPYEVASTGSLQDYERPVH